LRLDTIGFLNITIVHASMYMSTAEEDHTPNAFSLRSLRKRSSPLNVDPTQKPNLLALGISSRRIERSKVYDNIDISGP
jgi:hypothetical protein